MVTRILIVEDSPTDREILRYLLEDQFKSEAKFREASSLATAFRYLELGNIDCVVLDLQLPDSAGRETFQKINERFPDIPTIVMTHNKDRALAIDMIKMGAADYVLKDYTNPEDIFRRIIFAVEKHHRSVRMPAEKVQTVQQRLRAAFDDSFVAQIIISPEGSIQEANYQACRVLHRSREELCKLHHRDITTDDGFRSFDGLAQKLDKDRLVNWQTEQKYLRSNGFIFWANVSVAAIRKDGHAVALLLQLQDITELRRAEEALQRNNDDLEQFVYIASHDLREPLTAVAGYAGLLTRRLGSKLDEECAHFLNEILDSAKRMEQKIDDLLSFSRAGRSGVIQGTFHLGSAIEEARRNLVRRIEESSAVFEVQDDLPTLQGDRGLIAQVFQNLFSNSIKYRGVQPPQISIQAELYDDNFWLITVKDNGIGFEMQHKDRIFGVFQRLYTVEEYPGTGIGLAIAKKIVERHQGRIWTLSVPKQGSTFFFTLPSAPQT